jgi:hypothetical protein
MDYVLQGAPNEPKSAHAGDDLRMSMHEDRADGKVRWLEEIELGRVDASRAWHK